MTSEVSSHFCKNLSSDFKVLKHDLIQLLGPHVELARFLVDKFDLESTFAIVIEVELRVLHNVLIVTVDIEFLNDLVAHHRCEFDSSSYGAFLASRSFVTDGFLQDLLSNGFSGGLLLLLIVKWSVLVIIGIRLLLNGESFSRRDLREVLSHNILLGFL